MSYETKFKDLIPQKTVQNIIDFFQKRKYQIIVTNIICSEIETWSCRLLLLYNNNVVLTSNGKGTSKEYCLASGYAELYERFCNQETIKDNIFFRWKSLKFKNIEDIPYENLTIDSRLNNIINLEDQKKFFETFSLKGNNAIKYLNLQDDTPQYFQENVLDMFYGSVGMAAGNTIVEALNQSISELCEKQVCHSFYFTPIDKFYSLNLNNITNTYLNKIISNIKNLNYDFYIFDLSYNYNLPVLMSLLIDKNSYTLRVNFGAFPVFDIALERVLTELYQGICSYHFTYHPEPQIPAKTHNPVFVLTEYANSITSAPFFFENFIDNLIETDKYNSNVFLSNGNWTNDDIFSYYKNLFIKLNTDIYYKDYSLSDNIKAIQCICPQFIGFDPVILNSEKSSNIVKNTNALAAYKYLEIAFLFMMDGSNDIIIEKLFELYKFLDNNKVDEVLLSALIGREFLYPIKYATKKSLRFYLSNLPNLDEESFEGTIFYNLSRKYAFIQNYSKNKYSLLEIKEIFKNIFNEEAQDEDIQKCFNQKYLIEKIYIEPMKQFIHSQEFEDYVKTYYN